MLVLTRRAGESVMIDGQVEIKVLRIRGNQVHLGIDAPAETMIHRREVWLRLQESPDGAQADDGPGEAGTPRTESRADSDEAPAGKHGALPA